VRDGDDGRIEEIGEGKFAVGPAAAAANDQQHAAALDALRAHRGAFILVLDGEDGQRVIGSFVAVVADREDAPPPSPRVGLVIAVEFLRECGKTLLEARRFYEDKLRRGR
jgi:hypothetical protein